MSKQIIEVSALHKRYGRQVAVEDVSFTVDQGEIFGIIGPNGAGKTTTVECIEGLRKPDGGFVRVLGLDPDRAGDPDFEVVGQAANGVEAVTQAQELQADVVLMDLRMPEMGGVEAIKLLRARAPSARVIVLTTYDTDDEVLSAIEAGATSYLLKDAPREDLIRAVRAAHRGESVLAPSVAGQLMGRARRPATDAISPRELEVIKLIAAGANNREAAAKLFVSEATVKTHLLHVFEKLGVRDRAAAVSEAYKRHLIS